MTRQGFLIIVLVVISLYHVLLGVLTFMPFDFAASIAKAIFGMTFTPNDQLGYVAKLFGIYAIIFGIFCAMAAKDPIKYRRIIDVGILLYVLRLLNRLAFASQVHAAFQVQPVFTWIEVALLVFFGGALLVSRPKAA